LHVTNWILGQDNLLKRSHVKESFRHLDLHPSDRVLEIGSSALYYAGEIAKRVRQCVALDYFEGFEEQARDRRFPPSLVQVRADAHSLPFRDAEFDKVFISEVFPVLREPQRCAAEAFRVLKRGGKVVTVHGDVFHDMRDVFEEPRGRQLVRIAHERWGTPTSYDEFREMYFSVHGTNPRFFEDRDTVVRNLLTDAGFSDLELSWGFGRAARLFYCRLLLRALARTGKPVLGRGQALYLPYVRLLEARARGETGGLTLYCSARKH
jgi:ubiquinone/menaquinone biosynthesis C-methylase UbiE